MKPALISLFPLLTFIASVPIYKQDNPKLLAPTYTFICIEEHEVASGDTGDSIASSKNMDVAVLKSYNPSVDWENLATGSKVCVCGEITPPYPVETPTPTPSIPILIVPTPAPNYTPVPTYTVHCTRHYTCVSEDTGDIISKKCGLELLDLKTINPDVEWTDLQIGQKLCICTAGVCGHFPTPSTPVLVIPTATYVPPASCSTKYTVVQGDTGDIIATKLGITFIELNSLNPGVKWTLLQVGQKLCSPTTTPTPAVPILIIPTTSIVPVITSSTPTPSFPILIITSSITYPTTTYTPPTPTCTNRYTVVQGDTGDRIATKLGITFIELNALNTGVAWTLLQVGQVLCAPTITPTRSVPILISTTTPTAAAPILIIPTTSITPVIASTTPTPSVPILIIPTSITYPTITYTPPTATFTCTNKYTVVQGDTGDRIATKLGITFIELNALNTGVVWNLLQVGQELCVPNTTPTPSIPILIIPTASTTNTPSSLVLIIPTITSISYPPTIINIPPSPLSSVLIISTITSSTSIPTAPILIIPNTQALPVTHIYTLPECTETPSDSILTPISFSGPCPTQPVCPESTVIQNNCISPETVIVTQSDQAILVTVTLTSTIGAATVTNCPL